MLLLNSIVGPHDGPSEWHFWFIEALVHIFIAVAALLTTTMLRRANERFPFGFPLSLAAVGLLARYDLFGLRFGAHAPVAVSVLWLFALGWAAARATRVWQRLVVTAAVLATIPGFFAAEPTATRSRLDQYSRVLALVASLLAGIACAAVTAYVRRRLSVHIRRFRRTVPQAGVALAAALRAR